jgi:hypothetical protein
VQVRDEFLGQRIAIAAERPVLSPRDIVLLGFV